ncbi:MAG: hypothetical protein EHM13_14005 [Acidobacteria bacterium]|nr:MAG: hypothetical protein EHM13_14005 [Acidobacteriota bacterium]
MLRFLTDKRLVHPSALNADFYREEFLKHQRCLERQREYYSERAIDSAEAAIERILGELDRICANERADELVSGLLHQFDIVTRLSAWSDPKKVH